MRHPLATWVLPLAVLACCARQTQGAPSTVGSVQPREEVVFQKPLPFHEKVVVLRQEAPVETLPSAKPNEATPDAKTGLRPIPATCTQAGRYSVFRVGADGGRQLLWRKTFCEAQTFDLHGAGGDDFQVVSKPKFFDVLVEPGNPVVLYEPGSGPLFGEVVNVGPVKQIEEALGQPDWRMRTELNISMRIGAPFVKSASVQGSLWRGDLSVTMQKVDGQTSRFKWKNRKWQQQDKAPSP